jgi:hypothetical protein
MDKFISGLVLAGLSGLTWIAYNHSGVYIYFAVPILAVISLIFFGTTLWEIGVNSTHSRLMKFIKSDEREKSSEAVDGLLIINHWTFIGYFALSGYIVFLYFLPRILGQ